MGIRLIGRGAELGALLATLDRTRNGSGRIVLVSGEAGIGKSRLAQEVVAAAAAQGFATLEGRAHPLHAGLAYAPFVEALRPSSADTTALDLLLAAPRSSPGEPTLAKARMFEAVTAQLAKLAPALLFLDDLHWADLGTIELAHYVSRNAPGVLVLTTCREPVGPLRDLAMAVRRADPRDEIALQPLTDPAVTELATEILGQAPPSELIHDLTERAQGNPLFVTALTSAPITQTTLPTIVRDVVLGRLHAISEPARRLIEIVAVAGESGTAELLREIYCDNDFDGILRGLVQGGLVTEHLAGRTVLYRIAHPLYAEVAYAELTAHERRRAHAAVAEAIDRERSDDVLALAPHYLGAGALADPERTATVLAGAGLRALEIHAEDEALRYLKAAVAEAKDAELKVKVLDGIGRLHQGAGRLDQAAEAWNQAIDAGRAAGHTEHLGPLAFWLALLEAERGDFDASVQAIGVAMAAGKPADQARAVEYSVLAMNFAIRANDRIVLQHGAQELLQVGGAAAHLAKATLAILANDWATARSEVDAMVAAAERSPGRLSTMLRTIAGNQLLLISILTGDMAEAVRIAEHNRDSPLLFEYSMFRASGHYYVSLAKHLHGDLKGARTEIERGLELERRSTRHRMHAWMLMIRGWMNVELGRLAEGEADLDESAALYGPGIEEEAGLHMIYASARTSLAIQKGQPELAPGLPEFPGTLHDPISAGFRLMYAGQAAVAAGQDATEILAQLRREGRDKPFTDALADRLAGFMGEPGMSGKAASRLDSMGAKAMAAQAWVEHVERTGDPDPLKQCAEVFEGAGMSLWLERTRKLAKGLGVRLPTARRAPGLSKRELEVVGLLGEGLSNADIAARLFVSERTVESHLRNSYAKLGLHSRVALARWAADQIT
ncbi:AAA family ATPase [Actinocrispum sp. NPDC049592]|uniref:ATP-binding protein n=1 Tax=Actinocrispum sp. NPDC049592 TaxID=3154835 RepID=UPI003436BC29